MIIVSLKPRNIFFPPGFDKSPEPLYRVERRGVSWKELQLQPVPLTPLQDHRGFVATVIIAA